MTTLAPTFMNAIFLIDATSRNEDALVELAGMIPVLRPLVENEIDMDAPLNRRHHPLAKHGDAVNFLRNNLSMLNPAQIPASVPKRFSQMTLTRTDSGDFFLTMPVHGTESDQNYMVHYVLPTLVDALFEQSQTVVEKW